MLHYSGARPRGVTAENGLGVMANVNVKIDVSFPRYDCVPSAGGREFRRQLLLAAGKRDARGWSLADTFLRRDEGGLVRGTGVIVNGALVAAVGAPATWCHTIPWWCCSWRSCAHGEAGT